MCFNVLSAKTLIIIIQLSEKKCIAKDESWTNNNNQCFRTQRTKTHD
jgi:hypothetical protein